MKYLKWLLLIILAIVLGVLIVEYMTVHPLVMSTFLLLSALTGFIIIVFLALAFTGKRSLPLAIGVVIVSLLAGYLIRTEIFLGREDDRPIPAITREKGDPGDGHTASCLFHPW